MTDIGILKMFLSINMSFLFVDFACAKDKRKIMLLFYIDGENLVNKIPIEILKLKFS